MNINYSSVLQEHQLTAIRIFSTNPTDFDKKSRAFYVLVNTSILMSR
jgi:hypothetical protein